MEKPWKYSLEKHENIRWKNHESTSNDTRSSVGCKVSKGILVKFSATYLCHSSRQKIFQQSSGILSFGGDFKRMSLEISFQALWLLLVKNTQCRSQQGGREGAGGQIWLISSPPPASIIFQPSSLLFSNPLLLCYFSLLIISSSLFLLLPPVLLSPTVCTQPYVNLKLLFYFWNLVL